MPGRAARLKLLRVAGGTGRLKQLSTVRSVASLEQNGGIPMEDVLADFGLTMDDFHKMAETPLPEDPAQ